MKSTRLPGKILMPIPLNNGKPLLSWIIDELSKITTKSHIVVATSLNSENDILESFCNDIGVKCFRGSEDDVLSRFLKIIPNDKECTVVRLTADNPVLDIHVLEDSIKTHLINDNDYTYSYGLPIGMNFEIIKSEALLDLENCELSNEDKEHVTLHLKNNLKYKKGEHVVSLPDFYKKIRLTVDYPSDFTLLNIILESYSVELNGLTLIKNILSRFPWLFDSNLENIQKKQYADINEELKAAYSLLTMYDMKNAAKILIQND